MKRVYESPEKVYSRLLKYKPEIIFRLKGNTSRLLEPDEIFDEFVANWFVEIRKKCKLKRNIKKAIFNILDRVGSGMGKNKKEIIFSDLIDGIDPKFIQYEEESNLIGQEEYEENKNRLYWALMNVPEDWAMDALDIYHGISANKRATEECKSCTWICQRRDRVVNFVKRFVDECKPPTGWDYKTDFQECQIGKLNPLGEREVVCPQCLKRFTASKNKEFCCSQCGRLWRARRRKKYKIPKEELDWDESDWYL